MFFYVLLYNCVRIIESGTFDIKNCRSRAQINTHEMRYYFPNTCDAKYICGLISENMKTWVVYDEPNIDWHSARE